MTFPRKHALILSLALGLALAVGGYALTKTSGIASAGAPPAAAAATGVSAKTLAAKNAQLDALSRSLDKKLAEAEKPVETPAPRIVRRYVRPPAAVVTVSRHHGDDDAYEHEGPGGEDD